MSPETRTRIVTGLIAAAVTIWILHLGGLWWTFYVMLAAMICELEFFALMQAKGFSPHRGITLGISLALMLIAALFGYEFGAATLTFGILALLILQLQRPGFGTVIHNVSASMAAVLYIPWLLSHGIYLRDMPGPDGNPEFGAFAVLYVLAATFGADTGGYFAGRNFGRHRIAPRVSPKKTWEGLAGGVVAAPLFGCAMAWAFNALDVVAIRPAWYPWLAVFAMILAVVGLFGDLVESMLKRDADVKDSGNLLPGHGGLLDRIDAVLFTVPFSYYAFKLAQRFFWP